MADSIDVFTIDQDYPTTNALLVPQPAPQSYTIFIYKYNDWVNGNTDTVYSLAQSDVNPNGTWIGVFDEISQTYSPVTLLAVESNGQVVDPLTVVAMNSISQIVLRLKIKAPVALDAVGRWLFNDANQSGEILTAGL